MMTDEIVLYPSPILLEKTKEVEDYAHLPIDKMFEIMYRYVGIGLAAPQVGLPYRFFVLNTSLDRNKEKEKIFINPIISHKSDRTSLAIEGCLSIPGIRAEVSRPKTVMIEYLTLEGKKARVQYDGLMGRACQHEIDHLDGKLFIDLLPEEERIKLMEGYRGKD